eukprot:364354-Chlamydomonas_euryale.AAC.8
MSTAAAPERKAGMHGSEENTSTQAKQGLCKLLPCGSDYQPSCNAVITAPAASISWATSVDASVTTACTSAALALATAAASEAAFAAAMAAAGASFPASTITFAAAAYAAAAAAAAAARSAAWVALLMRRPASIWARCCNRSVWSRFSSWMCSGSCRYLREHGHA